MLYTLSMLLVQPLQTEMNFSSKYSLHVQSLVQTKTLTIKFVESKHYRKAAEALINAGNCISQNGFKSLWDLIHLSARVCYRGAPWSFECANQCIWKFRYLNINLIKLLTYVGGEKKNKQQWLRVCSPLRLWNSTEIQGVEDPQAALQRCSILADKWDGNYLQNYSKFISRVSCRGCSTVNGKRLQHLRGWFIPSQKRSPCVPLTSTLGGRAQSWPRTR